MKMSNLCLAGLALLGLGALSPAGAVDLNGAGATFPYPIYSKWFFEFDKETKNQINYQSIGSGGGIRQVTEGTVDFGASDAPMTDEQIAAVKGGIFHLPTVMGAVAVAYNVPGIKSLKLGADVLAEIFLGKITKWNDPKIAADNPGEKLPDIAVNVAHRSDGSGTSNIFTNYLSKVSPEWQSKVGFGTAVKWPVGVGGKGNEGVAGLIKQIPGTIGYVELAYAHENKIPFAMLKNAAGKYVDPSIESTTAAAAAALANMPDDFRVMITNAPGADAYPICGFTWLLVHPTYADKAKGKTLVEFLHWAYSKGEPMASSLDYAPLPADLIKKIDARIAQIKY
jgi:phosphate transport system substrate-binding protein